MLRLAFDFIITWRETRTRPNAYGVEGRLGLCKLQKELQGKNITGFVTAGYKF